MATRQSFTTRLTRNSAVCCGEPRPPSTRYRTSVHTGPKKVARTGSAVAATAQRNRRSASPGRSIAKDERSLLNALGSVDDSHSVEELTAGIQKHTHWNGRRVRPLHPWAEDKQLLSAVNQGEFLISGFR